MAVVCDHRGIAGRWGDGRGHGQRQRVVKSQVGDDGDSDAAGGDLCKLQATEKECERLFAAAAGLSGLLLFGSRSRRLHTWVLSFGCRNNIRKSTLGMFPQNRSQILRSRSSSAHN